MLDKLVNKKRVLLAVNYVFWLLVIIISASQLYIRFKGQYDGGWLNFFWRQSISWIGWAILTPTIIRVVDVLHQKVKEKNHQLTLHIISAIGFTLLYVFILSVLSVLFFNSQTPLLTFIKQNIFGATATNLLVYTLIAVFGYTLVFYKQTKKDESLKHELDLKNRELQQQVVSFKLNALKMQIQPHFLFNSLHSISSLIRKGENNQAIDTISLLSDLLRSTINFQETEFVKLGDEIDIIKKYLSIEKIRFDENLNIEYKIDASLNNCLVPSFILQPILENTFKHGFRNKQKGEISIECQRDGESILIRVNDNGEGLKPDFKLEVNGGIGLNNIRKRIHNMYDDKANFEIKNRNSGGVEASLEIPYRTA